MRKMTSHNHFATLIFLSFVTSAICGSTATAAEPQPEEDSDPAQNTDARSSEPKPRQGTEQSESPEKGHDENASSEEEDEFSVGLNGKYAIWGLKQQNFFLGRDHPLDDAKYVTQMFRLRLEAGRSAYGGVLRADFAQGWWGADNKPNVEKAAKQNEKGDVEQTTEYNSYAYFRKKGTHYDIHVDHAYIYFRVPKLPLRFELGRQHHAVGNKLVLDQDLDGVFLESSPLESWKFTANWAKVSEGFQSYKAPGGALMSDDEKWSDADLFGLQVDYDTETFGGQLFGLYYDDNVENWDYYPQGIGYFRARFQPQMTRATALGLKLEGKLPLGRALKYNAEFDYLFGRDEVENSGYGGNNLVLDQNNGELRGYNAYLDLVQKFEAGVPMDVGLTFGMGSGDEDPTGGAGNINKIQTQGFFGLTNVWEDSVMPDIGGITPQGLGSPASRGYRELENTTVGQFSYGIEPFDMLRLDAKYSYLRATEPIHGWNDKGPVEETSKDIGQEVDLNLKLDLYKGLKAVTLGGVFFPGEGASLLINGDRNHTETAWEVKQVLLYEFSTP